MQQAPRLPRESSGRAAETKERQSVHQTPCSAASPVPATRKQRQSSGDLRSAKAYLPRESSGSAAETKERQSVHQTPCSAASPTPATRKQRQSSGAYIRPPAMLQAPRLPRESRGRAAETKERQSVHQTPCSAASPTPATRKQRQSSGDQGAPKRTSDPLRRSKSHACHAKAAAAQRRPRSAKAYIRPPAVQQAPRLPRESRGRAAETKERQSVHQTPCSAASPTPATRKQRQSSGDQGAPKRTSDPLQCSKSRACHAKAATEQRRLKERQSVPATRKQRQRSGDQGAPKRTSDPLRRSKSHACHAKAAAAQRRPRSAKAYIRPPAVQQAPRLPRESRGRAAETKERQSVHQTPCSAASPTPATRKQRQRSGDQGAPKRTSDPLQCSKPHACHAKAAAEQRRPRSAKAYIRPPAAQEAPRLPRKSRGRAAETKERQRIHQTPCSAASPTPATRKQRQSSGDQGAPKRTSDPLQCHQAPRLPRKSSGRAAKPSDVKPCDDVKLSDIKHCDIMSSCVMSSCVMSSCVMSTCVTSSCAISSCVMSSCVMSSCVMSSCVVSTCVMSTCVMSSCVMSSSVI